MGKERSTTNGLGLFLAVLVPVLVVVILVMFALVLIFVVITIVVIVAHFALVHVGKPTDRGTAGNGGISQRRSGRRHDIPMEGSSGNRDGSTRKQVAREVRIRQRRGGSCPPRHIAGLPAVNHDDVEPGACQRPVDEN